MSKLKITDKIAILSYSGVHASMDIVNLTDLVVKILMSVLKAPTSVTILMVAVIIKR